MREIANFVKGGINIVPTAYTTIFSHAQLSDKRKEEIASRRDQLKVMEDDPPILSIVIEEMLSYKPGSFTLDDRYLQLEKILDAIDKCRIEGNTEKLAFLCSKIQKELSELSTTHTKNYLLECLNTIEVKIKNIQPPQIRAKL